MTRNLKRYYGAGDLHFLTFSCSGRLPLLNTAERRDLFLTALEATRQHYQFIVVGYVVMPEHVHLIVDEPRQGNLSTAIKALKQSVSRRVLGSSLLKLEQSSWPLLRFWQPRFYDFNVWSEKKRIEKLRYIHRNPVARGLVSSPELWPWSSYRYYAYGEAGLVAASAMFPQDWVLRKTG